MSIEGRKSLFERMFYKYQFLGEVERDGNVFKKYKKVHRFPMVKKLMHGAGYILALAAIAGLINLIVTLFYLPKK